MFFSLNANFVVIVAIGLLVVGPTVQQDATRKNVWDLKPGADLDPQNGYITKFISHGFDITKINLFGDLSLENLKDTIFEYEPVLNLTVCSSDGIYCYTCQDGFVDITSEEKNTTDTTVYKLEKSLHPLLNANVSDQTAGNYSYQLYESSYYGRISAESIYYQSYWNVKLSQYSAFFFQFCVKKKFKADVENLIGKNMTDYFKFIEKYGTHFFHEVTYGGMYRMESKATDRFVNDVSEADFKLYLETNLKRATDVNDTGNYSIIPSDFYYHNHYVNFNYGGDDKIKISNQTDFEKWQKTVEAEIVPIGWEKDTIYNLIKLCGIAWHQNVAEIVEKLKLATEIIETKYKINSYLEGLKVIQDNLYGHSMAGHFNPSTLQAYFESKLKEDNPVLDQTFWDNCWCTDHCAESILNRREWFPKPLPFPTTSTPSTTPSTTPTITTTITTTASTATTPSTIATTPTIPTTSSPSSTSNTTPTTTTTTTTTIKP